jgi:hypothetical protein
MSRKPSVRIINFDHWDTASAKTASAIVECLLQIPESGQITGILPRNTVSLIAPSDNALGNRKTVWRPNR